MGWYIIYEILFKVGLSSKQSIPRKFKMVKWRFDIVLTLPQIINLNISLSSAVSVIAMLFRINTGNYLKKKIKLQMNILLGTKSTNLDNTQSYF
jgi:hypothetical protein